MNWEKYTELFEKISDGLHRVPPYDKESYLTYVDLNFSRQKRWLKRGVLDEELVSHLTNLDQEQEWILITEPWCGDASHTNPFIYLLSEQSDKIHLSIKLRDDGNGMINDYLTNGGMSIPILVVRDMDGNDLFHWGPRPSACQDLFLSNKNNSKKSEADKKIELQGWYNKNKGVDFQTEFLELQRSVSN